MPIGDIYEHQSEKGRFVVQTGPSPEDYRVTGNLAEAKLIKESIALQQSQNQARSAVSEAGQQPEVQAAFRQAGSEARSDIGSGLKSAVVGAAPAIGAALGVGMLPAAIPAAGAGLAGVGLRAGAQGGAELVRQQLQGEEFNLGKAGEAAALSGGMDAVAGGLKGLFQGLMKKSPGVMHRISEQKRIEALDQIVKDKMTVDKAGVNAAYKNFENIMNMQGKAIVTLNETRPTLKAILDEMERRPAIQKQTGIMNKFNRLTEQTESAANPQVRAMKNLQFDEVSDLLKDINSAASAATNANEKRLLMEAKKALYRDIDNAPVPPAQLSALRIATAKAREAFAKGDLHDAIAAGTTNVSNVTGKQVINPKTVLDHIYKLKETDPLFEGSFKPGELDKVINLFEGITKALRGTSAEGTAIVLGSMGGMTGAAAGSALSGAPGIGASVGAAMGVSTPGMFTKIALNDDLAKWVVRMAGEGKPIDGKVLRPLLALVKPSTVASTLRGATAGENQ